MHKEIKHFKVSTIKVFNLIKKQCYHIIWSVKDKRIVNRWGLWRKNEITMLIWSSAVCNSKKSRGIKEQEAKVLLCSTPGKIPILGPYNIINILFIEIFTTDVLKKLKKFSYLMK